MASIPSFFAEISVPPLPNVDQADHEDKKDRKRNDECVDKPCAVLVCIHRLVSRLAILVLFSKGSDFYVVSPSTSQRAIAIAFVLWFATRVLSYFEFCP